MTVCFIGHRTVVNEERIKIKLFDTLSSLIVKGVDTFLFGSRSNFDFLCWEVVTKLKEQYPQIKRISYNLSHEVSFTSKEERECYEQILSKMSKVEVHYADYEEVIYSKKSQKANKNAYIMRNQDMIESCNICIFYYNKDYLLPKRKQSKGGAGYYQPKSGTAIAFNYALQKKKQIINLYDSHYEKGLSN